MKRLILLRHAKAVSKRAPDDRERVLAPEGRDEMEEIARALAAEPRPGLAFVSPAARTRETWSLAGLHGVEPHFVEGLYNAAVDALREVIRGAPDDAETVILVGHNPGIEAGAAELVRPEEAAQVASFPTAAFASIAFPVDRWADVRAGEGRLVRFVKPSRSDA